MLELLFAFLLFKVASNAYDPCLSATWNGGCLKRKHFKEQGRVCRVRVAFREIHPCVGHRV
jgi:hypothetical protein